MAVTPAALKRYTDAFLKEPRFVMACNSVARSGMQDILTSRAATAAATNDFSCKIPQELKATNQKSSGRCWLFAALNVMRTSTVAKYKLSDDFEFSQSYLFFWDKFEKVNYFLENIISTAGEPLDGRLVQHLLTAPLNDGGQWDMLVNVIKKYGVVPKSVFPECHTSGASRLLNRFLTNKCRGFAKDLRALCAAGDEAAVAAARDKMLEEAYRVLVIHFGVPPTKFDWTFHDKDKKHHVFRDQEPVQFYKDHIDFDVNEYVSLINDPRNEYGATYTVDKLGNVVGGNPILYINLPIDSLRKHAMREISGGKPVWFGCDVGKFFQRSLGLLDTKAFDYELVYGCKPDMTKEERLRYGESLMTHAMVLTGFDQREGEEKPRKWRVENSWGDKDDNKGYLKMSDEWFDQYMYQIIVRRSDLDPEELAALEKTPTVLPAWDPMGALATVSGLDY